MRLFTITSTGKPDGKLDYTVKNWEKLRESCMQKAEELNDALGEEEKEEQEEEKWTACRVERAIWADAAMAGKAN
jgi:hypothetical protein